MMLCIRLKTCTVYFSDFLNKASAEPNDRLKLQLVEPANQIRGGNLMRQGLIRDNISCAETIYQMSDAMLP